VSSSSSPVVRGILLGARLGLSRLRHRRTAGALFLALALCVAGAWIELSAGSLGAVDRALAGTFRLVVPLLTLALVSRAGTREGVGAGAYPLARFGLPRFAVAFGGAASGAVAAVAASAALAAVTVLFSHSASAPPLAGDMLMSAWIGGMTALAYAGWVAFGGTFWGGRGRWAPVVADFLIGGSTGLAGALLPRAHASSLLGLASGPLSLPPQVSSAALVGMGAGLLVAAAFRSGR